jgi:hypothetical protein
MRRRHDLGRRFRRREMRGVHRMRGVLAGSSSSAWQDFFDRFSVGQDRHWSPEMIGDGFGPVDSEMAIDGGPEIFGLERAFDGIFTFGIGCADDLAGAHPAAGDEHGHGSGPVVAAGLGDAGLSAFGS